MPIRARHLGDSNCSGLLGVSDGLPVPDPWVSGVNACRILAPTTASLVPNETRVTGGESRVADARERTRDAPSSEGGGAFLLRGAW